jgi:hypothetical protein
MPAKSLLRRGKGRQALGWVMTAGPTPAGCATAIAGDRCRRAVKAYQAFTPWWCEKIRPVRTPGLHSAHNSLRIIGGGVPSRRDFY